MGMRILLLAIALGACGGSSKPPAQTDHRTLFERLGGQPAIDAIVHDFVVATKADARISARFANVDPAKLEASMDVHVCSITGGGCTYTGKSMVDAHTGMHLTHDEMVAFIDDLRQVLIRDHVPEREGMDVLHAFEGLEPQVVGH
jgi:hemoglobin